MRWTAVLAVLVLAVLGFAGYKFVSGVGRARPAAAASPRPSPPGGHADSRPRRRVQGSRPGQHGPGQRVPASASGGRPSAASPVTVQALAPASVAAFGPAGLADGDDPQRSGAGDRRRPGPPWTSQWYATARFGA